MAFIKRLGFYLFGLALGLIFLAVFLKKKSDETGVEFCYFPNCRTLKDMRSKPIFYSDRISEMIQDKELDTLAIKQFFIDGEVNFASSDTNAKPCKKYLIENQMGGVWVTMTVKNCEDKILIETLE